MVENRLDTGIHALSGSAGMLKFAIDLASTAARSCSLFYQGTTVAERTFERSESC